MEHHIFINSTLETKAVSSLQAQIEKELLLADPDKSIAQLLQENNEEKNITTEEKNDQNHLQS
jgi:hypothetical protein